MVYFDVAAVVAGPRLRLARADSTGTYIIYSGYVSLVRNTGFRGILRPDDRQPVAFFLPDSATYPADPAAAGLEVSVRRFQSLGNPNLVTFGAYDERVSVAPDPRGGEHRWLQVSLQVPLMSVAAVDINYRVTIESDG